MTDLVERLREYAESIWVHDRDTEETRNLCKAAADEIVHLRRDVETFETLMKQRHKAVTDDIRAWRADKQWGEAQYPCRGSEAIISFLNAYCKDRGIE